MRRLITAGAVAAAALSLAACGGTETTTDEDTAVTDVDPGEGDGTIDDTTVIDGTIDAEEEMGMENGMPADSAPEPGAEDGAATATAPTPTEEDGDAEPEGGEAPE